MIISSDESCIVTLAAPSLNESLKRRVNRRQAEVRIYRRLMPLGSRSFQILSRSSRDMTKFLLSLSKSPAIVAAPENVRMADDKRIDIQLRAYMARELSSLA